VQGLNVTIIVCGQKNSGKTFTIEGNSSSSGIIPLSLNEIFKNGIQRITISSFEVYNDSIRDLLSESDKSLEPKEDPSGITIKGLVEKCASNFKEAITCLSSGKEIERSHRIFRVKVEGKSSVQISQINFVELNGCEYFTHTKRYIQC